jgi:hypothetical protein
MQESASSSNESQQWLIDLLNRLLEAERAGAKVIAALMDTYPEHSTIWEKLREVQRDEARNCAVLKPLVERLGGAPSNATGDFVQKTLAIQDPVERLQFLNRGQGWVVRKIQEALPKIEDPVVRQALDDMVKSHVENIDACDALI